MPKIYFIQPTQYAPDHTLCKQKRLHLPGLVFPLLAAMTPSHWRVQVTLEVIEEVDFESDADIIGIGSMGHATFRAIDIAHEFRKRGKCVVMGGYMASIMVSQASKHVDSVIIGDAELSYPMMLNDFELTGRLQKIYNNPIQSLEGLPLPRYDILTNKKINGMLPVQAGRGCPHTCSFCSIACLYKGKYLTRPIPEVLRDIKAIRSLGIRRFYLIDDNIVSRPQYLEELCDSIKPLNMSWATQCSLELSRYPHLLKKVRAAGATMMSFGVESISQEGLDALDKKWLRVDNHQQSIKTITKAGIVVSSEMMLGTDGDTLASIKATGDFIHSTRIPIPRFYLLTPMPGTRLFDEFKEQNRLLTTDFELYTGTTCVFKPKHMSAEQLTQAYWQLNERIFSIGSILYRTLLHPLFLRRPLVLLFAFFVNLHYRRYIRRHIPPNIF